MAIDLRLLGNTERAYWSDTVVLAGPTQMGFHDGGTEARRNYSSSDDNNLEATFAHMIVNQTKILRNLFHSYSSRCPKKNVP